MGAPEQIVASSKLPAEWCEPAALTLDESGRICDCSKASEELFGYSLAEMAWQPVTSLLPQLSGINLVQGGEINPRLIFLSRCGHQFQVRNRHGGTIASELNFVNVSPAGKLMLRLIIRPPVSAVA